MTLKQLRRALLDRGAAPNPDFHDKPDEIKLLREHAKSTPSVCDEASGLKQSRSKRVAAGVSNEATDDVDAIIAQLDEASARGSAADNGSNGTNNAQPGVFSRLQSMFRGTLGGGDDGAREEDMAADEATGGGAADPASAEGGEAAGEKERQRQDLKQKFKDKMKEKKR